MNKEIKERWIAALRSGKYKQAQNVLRTGKDRLCCLGVLCDVVDPERWYVEEDSTYMSADGLAGRVGGPYYYRGPIGPAERKNLPVSIQCLMGMDALATFSTDSLPQELRDRMMEFDANKVALGRPMSLAELNDAGASFELIADIIEADPEWTEEEEEEEFSSLDAEEDIP